MAQLFTITTASNTIRLHNGRQGEASFTAFNAGGRPIRGRAQVVPEDATAADWLSVTGEAERSFDIAEAHQYTVRIDVPPEAPAGGYAFRLDMVGVENPDEHYAQGPTVTFRVAEAAPAKPFPWWIVAVVAAVLVIGGLAAFLLWPRDVEVPALRGETIGRARDLLTEANLEVGDPIVEEASGEIDEGSVIRTEPAAGEAVPRRSVVTLVVSAGPETVTIPNNVEDRTEADAREILQNACELDPCLVVAVREAYSEAVDEGRVIETEPPIGAEVPQGSEVTLVVSAGSALVEAALSADADNYWHPPGTPIILIFPPPQNGISNRLVLSYSQETETDEEFTFGPGGPGVVAIRFDLSELPAGATVEAATLHLYLEEAETGGLTVLAQRATAPWDESLESERPTDCDPTDQATRAVGLGSGWYDWDVTSIVRHQHENPGENYGLCLELNDVGRRIFTSREGTTDRRPYLELVYRRP